MNLLLDELNKINRGILETDKEYIDLVKNTGSTYFEVNTENSDIDYIIYSKTSNNFSYDGNELSFASTIRYHNGLYLQGTEKIEHYRQEDFESCYILYKSKLYNLLFMYTEEAFGKWMYATRKMKHLIGKDPKFFNDIKNKKYRVEIFEKFKEEFRGKKS